MLLTEMEMTIQMVMVGDGKLVKQFSQTPLGAQGFTVDLRRIQKVIPEYSPADTYDPAAYKGMLDTLPDKKPLPAGRIDGVEVQGYEVNLEKGRLSLPSNVPIALPDPARMRLWINPRDGIARKVELDDDKGKTFLTTSYQDVRLNVPLSMSRFEFAFPGGMEPADATDIILGAVAATRRPPAPTRLPPASPGGPSQKGEKQ